MLKYKTVEPESEIDSVVILCHGYGAPATDLIPIGHELAGDEECSGTLFVFPEAPYSLDEFSEYDARAWWPLSLRMLEDAMSDPQVLPKHTPEGLGSANEKLQKLTDSISKSFGIPYHQIVIGGFSQGAMLSTECFLSHPQPLGGLAIFSGTLICKPNWAEKASKMESARIVQTHGRTDQVLPFFNAVALKELFKEQKLSVDFHEFSGGHTIPQQALEMLVNLVSQVKKQ